MSYQNALNSEQLITSAYEYQFQQDDPNCGYFSQPIATSLELQNPALWDDSPIIIDPQLLYSQSVVPPNVSTAPTLEEQEPNPVILEFGKRLDLLEQRVNPLEQRVNPLEQRVDLLEQLVTNNQSRLEEEKIRLCAEIEVAIAKIRTWVAELASMMARLEQLNDSKE